MATLSDGLWQKLHIMSTVLATLFGISVLKQLDRKQEKENHIKRILVYKVQITRSDFIHR
jgi:hypothetical protein